MKLQSDKKRTDRNFEVGEMVFVKLRAHRQQSVAARINAKLAARYFGPYQILERIGAVAYKLKLPVTSKIHSVFHVSLLKKAVGNYDAKEELPEDMLGEDTAEYEPEIVLASRKVKVQDADSVQLLVQWKGKTADEATWEDAITIKSQFLEFSLEDKARVSEGSIDGNDPISEEIDAAQKEQLANQSNSGSKE